MVAFVAQAMFMNVAWASGGRDKGNNVRLVFLLTLIDLSSESPSSFLREDRTRVIYVLLEHLVDCFFVAVGLLWSSKVFKLLSTLKKFYPISSRLFHFPFWGSRYPARFIPCFQES